MLGAKWGAGDEGELQEAQESPDMDSQKVTTKLW